MWKPGDMIAWRGIYRNCIWHALPMIVVKDSPEELVLALLPGADGFVPEGYSEGKHNGKRRWDFTNKPWKLDRHIWHTNRLLYVLEPRKYYGTCYIWNDDNNEFLSYYINFQLPFCRTPCGVDALDLELDLVIKPDFGFEWKDLDDYQKGIESDIILEPWIQEIEAAKQEILEKLMRRQYPFDGKWLDWRPDPNWSAPCLPPYWDQVD